MSSMPPARFEPETRGGNAATIGKAVKIVGQIYSREDLYRRWRSGRHGGGPGAQADDRAERHGARTVKAREVVVLGTSRATWKRPIRSRSARMPS